MCDTLRYSIIIVVKATSLNNLPNVERKRYQRDGNSLEKVPFGEERASYLVL